MSNSVKKNISSVYLATFVPAVLTYFFWFVITFFYDSSMVGTIAAIGSFSMLLSSVSNFDAQIGMKRFLGKAVAENDWLKYKNIVSSTTILLLISSIAILVFTLNPFYNFLALINFEEKFIPMIIIIVLGHNLSHIFRSSLISMLKSHHIILPAIVSSLSRFVLFFSLFYFINLSDVGIAWSYSTFYALISIVLFVILFRFLGEIKGPFFNNTIENMKLVFHGSLAVWIPSMITVFGTQLSILTIFAFKGSAESGLFYIPYAIYNVLFLVSGSINQVIHPVISGKNNLEEQKNILKSMLKFTFLGTIPITSVALSQANLILSIFGGEFLISGELLTILLYSFPFAILGAGISLWLFARGEYKKVLLIELAANIPRIILYFILVPMYGGIGGSFAFIIGTIFQVITSVYFVERNHLKLNYPTLAIIGVVPFGIGYIFESLNFGLIGAIIGFILSYVIFLKFKIIKENDIKSALDAILPSEKSTIVANNLSKNLKKIHLL